MTDKLPRTHTRYKTKPGFPLAIVFLWQVRDGKAVYFSDKAELELPIKEFLEIYEEWPQEAISKMETTEKFEMTEELGEKLDKWLEKKYSDELFIRKNWHQDFDREAIIVTTVKEEIIPFNNVLEEIEDHKEEMVEIRITQDTSKAVKWPKFSEEPKDGDTFVLQKEGFVKVSHIPSGKFMDDPTIPQTPVSGISEPTAECNHCGNRVSQGIWLERQGYCGTSCQYDAKHKKTQDKSKSIWKDVSELPEDLMWQEILIRRADLSIGFAEIGSTPKEILNRLNSKDVIDFCTITDFINDYESEKKARIELEEMVKKITDLLCRFGLSDGRIAISGEMLKDVLQDKIK